MKMKWTLVGPTFPFKGGIAQHTTDLAVRLCQRGDTAVIETWKRQYPGRLYPGVQKLDEPERRTFDHVERRLSWNRPDTWVRVGRQAGRRSDVVCIALVSPLQFPAYELVARSARKRGSAVIAIAHNVLPHESTRADRVLARRLYRLVDGMLVHSDSEAERAAQLGAKDIRVRELPFFFETDLDPSGAQQLRHRIAFVGFVRPYKGLDVLIRAIAASNERPRLTITGEFWDDVDDYRAVAREAGVDDLCIFQPGYVSSTELAREIDASDALVVPYRSATGTQHPRIGRSRLRPCIVSDVGDMAEQVLDGIDGFVVPPDDPAALARAIDRLYEPGVHDGLVRTLRPVIPDAEWRAYLTGLDELVESA